MRKEMKQPKAIQLRPGDLDVALLIAEAKTHGFPTLSSYLRWVIVLGREKLVEIRVTNLRRK